MEKPKVFIKNIEFNDNTKISLKHDSIIVFTGANNSGKSQVLKDIEICFESSNIKPIVIKSLENEFCGLIDEDNFFREHFILKNNGFYGLLGTQNHFLKPWILSCWNEHTLNNGLYKLFVRRLSTEIRLISSNALLRCNNPEIHPIYRLNKSESLAQSISDYFNQAFGVDLIVNRNEMQTIPLHIGKCPNKKEFTIDKQDEYYNQISQFPKLQDQGDGMRSFASILLEAFTCDYPIVLIDEPEAFLHPPQARILGKMLAKSNPNNRQLLISTHSEDFLQGLLDADSEKVTVVRINRENEINRISVLQNKEIKKLWGNPLLRYSNILSGLFHEKVIVCESDYDCLFYQAVMDAVYELNGKSSPNVLFTHCGGKSRVKDVINALRSVNVPVAAICDFDLLNSSQDFKAIVSSLGINWSTSLESDMKIIYETVNGKNSKEKNEWANLKCLGKYGLKGDAPRAYEKVEAVCQSAGLFIVPVGEMECFDKTINKKKKDWVYYILENYKLADERKLEEARNFVKSVINYKL